MGRDRKTTYVYVSAEVKDMLSKLKAKMVMERGGVITYSDVIKELLERCGYA
ncbi:hypothetical protein [Pyrobaculum sp.]|uniref:hypothetical protein n=1 Tax=Pyrobaculum sp. TaxID=2004705 RepID=UPI003D116AF6